MNGLAARVLTALLRAYRLLLSPWLGNQCRFEPTCSRYALEAVERHGAAMGGCLMVARLARCHPWCDGGHDPVPEQRPQLFSRLRTVPTTTAGPEATPSPLPSSEPTP